MAENQSAEAQHDQLSLRVAVSIRSSTAVIDAILKNAGSEPWEYMVGGDLPPVLQIEVHDAEDKEVYGWQPPPIAAHWRSIRLLEPGASLAQKAEVTAQGRVSVRARVFPLNDFQTPEIEVVLPGSDT